jgi:hypothetical protein
MSVGVGCSAVGAVGIGCVIGLTGLAGFNGLAIVCLHVSLLVDHAPQDGLPYGSKHDDDLTCWIYPVYPLGHDSSWESTATWHVGGFGWQVSEILNQSPTTGCPAWQVVSFFQVWLPLWLIGQGRSSVIAEYEQVLAPQ